MTEIKPTYKFVESTETDGKEITPIRRTIAKTMEVTENFNLFDVLTYIAKMKKAVEDKQVEIDGINTMITAYEKELKEIENELSVQAMESDFQKEVAKQNESLVKEELIKSGKFVEKV